MTLANSANSAGCGDGNIVNATNLFNLQSNETIFIFINYDYGVSGIFEFQIKNFLNNNLTNVSWDFDTKNSYVINSTSTSILQPSEEIFVYIDYNFTTTGTFNVNPTARNGTLIDSINLTITIS